MKTGVSEPHGPRASPPDVHSIGRVAVQCDSAHHSESGERAVIDGLPPYPPTEELGPAKPPTRWVTISLLCVAIVIVYGALFAMVLQEQQVTHSAVAQGPVSTPAPPEAYDNGFEFADSVPIADRQWIVEAVARARPEAIRLIKLIDDRTTVAPLRDGANLGLTGQLSSGRYRIQLDLERLDGGMRANRELVLMHELGHVIDRAFLPDPVRDWLAAEIPASGSCRGGRRGDCAPPQEKFADTFAKWAYRGALSYSRGAGYHVPVPPSLEAWGASLASLAYGYGA